MLPIVDKPTILYVIEEALQAGIEDIVLIQGRGKTAIEDFFDVSYELEEKLAKDGKNEILESIKRIRSSVNIISIRQKAALGLGHAVYCSKPVVGDEAFAVMLGDEITFSKGDEENITHFLGQQSHETGASAVWVLPVEAKNTHKYGIVDVGPDNKDLSRGKKVLSVVEKPAPDKAPSTWALPGRYVFNAEIFKYLENTKPGKNGEIQLSDAMSELARQSEMNAYSFKARRYDAGDKLGFLIANIDIALEHPEIGADLLNYLKNKIK
jgi:UTP--glucose-1-phosphate uridylyltransferase